jgi:hypothetical protein
MARSAMATDFDVMVEGIGNFRFAKRTMRDELAIQVEYARMIDGVIPTDWLHSVAGWISALTVLTVKAPDGWDIEAVDPLDPDTYANLALVYEALVTRERSFRKRPEKDGETGRAEQGENG